MTPLDDTFAAGKRTPTWHGVFGWTADQIKDEMGLIDVTVSGQDGFCFEHFAKHTADTPHINGGGVFT